MRHATLFVLSLWAASSAASCEKPKPVQVTPKTARVTAVGPAGLTLDVELDVYNPNSFALDARRVSGVLQLGDGVEVARGSAEPRGAIAAKSTSTVPAVLGVAWTNLPALLPYALSGSAAPYRFQGVATLSGPKLDFDVPFTVSGDITRAQLVEAGLRGLGR